MIKDQEIEMREYLSIRRIVIEKIVNYLKVTNCKYE
jgi:hypothetical protein